jgi:hypothetical protein
MPRCPRWTRTGATRHLRAVTITVAAAAALGCDDPVDYDYAWGAIVFGRVTTTSGAVLSDAIVRVTMFRDTCASGFVVAKDGMPTDAGGNYRVMTASAEGETPACLQVTVTPPSSSGLQPVTIEGTTVRLRRTDGQVDSVRVDVTVR